jgi:hypothetical protein
MARAKQNAISRKDAKTQRKQKAEKAFPDNSFSLRLCVFARDAFMVLAA